MGVMNEFPLMRAVRRSWRGSFPPTSAPCAPDAARSAAMHSRPRFIRTLTIVAVLCARAGVAHCAWTVDAGGACVRKWAPSDLLRGPVAIVNAPLRPVRGAAGAAEYAWNKSEWRWWYTVVLGSAVTGVGAAAGLVEGVWWVGTGLADTLTGGYFEITPEGALDRSVRPELSTVIAGSAPAPTEDRCGRSLAASK